MKAEDTAHPILDRSYRLPKHVVYRAFAHETVVVNLERGIYHGLNATAGRMLEALERSLTARDAAGRLATELRQPTEIVENDLARLCSDLLSRDLIEVAR